MDTGEIPRLTPADLEAGWIQQMTEEAERRRAWKLGQRIGPLNQIEAEQAEDAPPAPAEPRGTSCTHCDRLFTGSPGLVAGQIARHMAAKHPERSNSQTVEV